MRLVQRINAAGLSPGVARTFSDRLAEVAGAKGGVAGDESALIQRLFGKMWGPGDEAAPFEALWPHAELFLTACVYIAVADGHYDVEEARVISGYAHRLGLSAGQLGELEARILKDIADRGARRASREARAGLKAGS